jgi:hypothetical protein
VNAIARFGRFWWDFIVGDDWTSAALVVVAIAATAIAVHASLNPWWLLPAAVLVTLYISLRRATRASRAAQRGTNNAGAS